MSDKKIYGINKKMFFDMYQEVPITVYNTCLNCGTKWQEQIKGFAVTSQMTNKKYDFCSECYKDESN